MDSVKIADDLTLTTELVTNACEALHDGASEREHVNPPEHLYEGGLFATRIVTRVDTIIDLAVGNDADRQSILSKGGEEAY